MSKRIKSLWKDILKWFKGDYTVKEDEFVYFWDDAASADSELEVVPMEQTYDSKVNRISLPFLILSVLFVGLAGLVLNTLVFAISLVILILGLSIHFYLIKRDYKTPINDMYRSLIEMNKFDFRDTLSGNVGKNPIYSELRKFRLQMNELKGEMMDNSQSGMDNIRIINYSFNDFQERLKSINMNLDQSYSNVVNFQESKGYVNLVSEGIDRFTITFDEALKNITELTAIIKSVGKQVSMLSLNAGIEAARAGESGTGFGVVANNLRRLSQYAIQSTSEIKHVTEVIGEQARTNIEDISGALGQLEVLVEQSHQTVNRINTQLSQANSRFEKVGDLTQSVEHNLEQNFASFDQLKV